MSTVPELWAKLRPHTTQSQLWLEPATFKAVVAGRGSGKSTIAKRYLVIEALKQKGLYFYTLPTYNQARLVAWTDLKELCKSIGVVKATNETLLSINLVNGSTIRLFGVDRAHRAEGVQYRGGVIDECSDTDPTVFERTFLPALGFYHGWCWLIGVPKLAGIGGMWFKSKYDEWLSNYEPDTYRTRKYASYHWTSETVLDKDSLALAKGLLDEDTYAEQYMATWGSLRGTVFYAFTDENILSIPNDQAKDPNQDDYQVNIRPEDTVWVAMDFNVDPMAWIVGITANAMYAYGEVFDRNTNTERSFYTLLRRLDQIGFNRFTHRLAVYGDAASRQRTSNASASNYMLLEKLFRQHQIEVDWQIPKANPKRADRLAMTNWAFRAVDGTHNMYIHPRCSNLLRDIYARSYIPGTSNLDDKKDPLIGHLTDALGYAVCAWHRVQQYKAQEITLDVF